MEKISIIIPVYNVQKFLSKCIDSVIKQTYFNIEIILVDDGSTDDSGKICDEYLKKDKRIKVYHKINGGLSDARNYGIDKITGNYITFVDSDDFISTNYVEYLYNLCKKTNTLISACRFERFKNENDIKDFDVNDKECLINIVDNEDYYMKTLYQYDHTLFSVSSCAKLFKKDIFKNLRFEKGRLNEDFLIIKEILKQTPNIAIGNNSLYYYRVTNNSITNSKFNKNKLYIIEYSEKMLEEDSNNNALKVYIYTRSIDILTIMKISNYHNKSIEDRLWANVKKYRIIVLKSSMTRLQIKFSSILSFFGKNILVNCNVLIRKIKNINIL